MMRSLYSGVSGLKTHQTKMDVIGNNIANVNTVAYKSSSVTFSEIMYQTTQGASGANALTGTGGTNAKQIGLGVTTGAINTSITTAGASQTTGNPFDIKITGDSFFIVNDGTTNYFTRAGAFYVDGAGNLAMTSTGYNVMGWQVDKATGSIKQDTVSALNIMSEENQTAAPAATSEAIVGGIIDKNNTNVSSENGQVINLSFYDNLGYAYTSKLSIHSTADDGVYSVELDDILDSKGNSIIKDGMTLPTLGSQGADGIAATMTFDTSTGVFSGISTDGTASGNTISLGMASLGGNFSDINLDFSATRMFNNGGSSTIGASSGDLNGLGAGKKLGAMIGVSISSNGMIHGTYDNGDTKTLGQIAVANFSNASGLSKEGENLYASSLNSGEFDGVGQDITANGGSMATGVLEMSNVDLSSEFTEMITTQRGFQANSRIITTSDSMLEELINLKR